MGGGRGRRDRRGGRELRRWEGGGEEKAFPRHYHSF